MDTQEKQKGERLQKILSQAGIASRRAAEDLIREGRVKVNGQVVRELGARANRLTDRITVDGRQAQPEKHRYLIYHKPVGVVSTMFDPEGRPAVGDMLRRLRLHLFPVGRLDFESSGLLLLTNDGELAQKILHPRYSIPKIYRVKVRGHLDEKALARLRRGIRLTDGVTAPAEIEVEGKLENKTRLRISIKEGRQRQIRRMFEAIGHPVDRLSRAAIGPLRLGSLAVGAYREITPREVVALRQAVHPRARDEAPARRRRAASESPPARRSHSPEKL